MICRKCNREMPENAELCSYCGKTITAGLAIGEDVRTATVSGLGLLADQTPIGIKEYPRDVVAGEPVTSSKIEAASTVRGLWKPQTNKVSGWAITRELNHYEVLELDENDSDEEVAARIKILDDTLEDWAADPEKELQSIGSRGKNRLYELKKALERRAEYNIEVARTRRERALMRVREELHRYVEKDRVLQWNEWQSLELKAREEEISQEELEEMIREQRIKGVLTGLTVGDKEVRTVMALRDRCRGRGEQIIEPIWNGEMDQWLDLAADKKDLAAEVRQITEQYADQRVSGATLLLWRIGEKRLVLTGKNGTEEVTSVRQLIDCIQSRGLEEPALAALTDRRLENWLRVAMNQEDMAEVAMLKRDEGRKGLLEVIEQAESRRGESFEFENGFAYTLGELIELCDIYVDEAQGYLFDGILGNWLAKRGNGPLARQANSIVHDYDRKRRMGLELFVRELCKKTGSEPYPHLVAQPKQLDLGILPVGARTSQSIRLKNEGRGFAWGTITVEPMLPGLSVTSKFDTSNAIIDITLDALEVKPGDYRANIIISSEGVPTTCQVPLRYQIVPLTVTFEPPSIEFDKIPHGKAEWVTLTITITPENGRLVGTPSIDPTFKGLQVGGHVDGSMCQLQVGLDTKPHEPGKQYESNIHLYTNVGRFDIPVRFRTALRWDVVAAWTVSCSVITGIILGLCRSILAKADPAFGSWFLSYQSHSPQVLITGGLLGAIIVGAISIPIFIARKKGKLSKK